MRWCPSGGGAWNAAPVQTVHTQRTYKQDDYAAAGMVRFDSVAYPVEVEVRSGQAGAELVRPQEWAGGSEAVPGGLSRSRRLPVRRCQVRR